MCHQTLIRTLANKKYMIVEVCTRAVQVEVPYSSSTASAVTESGTFFMCANVGTGLLAHTHVKSAKE